MPVPTSHDLTIYQGASFRDDLYWYNGFPVTKAISAITLGYPPVITATGHGLPTNRIPVQLSGIVGTTDLNTNSTDADGEPINDGPVYALKIDANTFSLPDIDASEMAAYVSGGFVAYTAPQDLTGYTAHMQIRASVGASTTIMDLTDVSGQIVLGGTEGKISIVLSAAATAALTFDEAVYDLKVTAGDGTVTAIVYGNVSLEASPTQ